MPETLPCYLPSFPNAVTSNTLRHVFVFALFYTTAFSGMTKRSTCFMCLFNVLFPSLPNYFVTSLCYKRCISIIAVNQSSLCMACLSLSICIPIIPNTDRLINYFFDVLFCLTVPVREWLESPSRTRLLSRWLVRVGGCPIIPKTYLIIRN